MATDANGGSFQVGDVVNIPCVVTSVSVTVGIPTLGLTTKYEGSNGSTESVSGIESCQVVVNK